MEFTTIAMLLVAVTAQQPIPDSYQAGMTVQAIREEGKTPLVDRLVANRAEARDLEDTIHSIDGTLAKLPNESSDLADEIAHILILAPVANIARQHLRAVELRTNCLEAVLTHTRFNETNPILADSTLHTSLTYKEHQLFMPSSPQGVRTEPNVKQIEQNYRSCIQRYQRQIVPKQQPHNKKTR